jgi:VanZ family protein
MGYLLLGSIALILFGTLYPFGFDCPASLDLALGRFRPLWHPIGRGDLAANLVLFVPLGLAAAAWASRLPAAARYGFALGLGAVLSMGVELAQTCTLRTASWSDVALNVASTAIGVLLLPLCRHAIERIGRGRAQADIPAALLLGMFAVWQLAPFVPTIDWQKWRNALKPLLLNPEITVPMILGYAVLWLVIARLALAVFNPARPPLLWIALAAGQFALELVIVGQVIRLGEVVGAVLGLGLATVLVQPASRWRDPLLAALLAGYIVDQGLQPYTFTPGGASFSWLPFAGFLHGSLFVAVQSFGQKLFTYGGLIWLATRAGLHLGWATAVTALLVLALEIAQTRLPGRVAEITDPLLALLAAGVIHQLDTPHRRGSGRRPARTPRRDPART